MPRIFLCLLNNNETYSDLIEIAPEIEPQSTETHHISNTYLNEYGVEDDDEKSEGNELDDVESDFPGTGTDHDEEDSNKDQFRKNKSTLKGMLVDLVSMPVWKFAAYDIDICPYGLLNIISEKTRGGHLSQNEKARKKNRRNGYLGNSSSRGYLNNYMFITQMMITLCYMFKSLMIIHPTFCCNVFY